MAYKEGGSYNKGDMKNYWGKSEMPENYYEGETSEFDNPEGGTSIYDDPTGVTDMYDDPEGVSVENMETDTSTGWLDNLLLTLGPAGAAFYFAKKAFKTQNPTNSQLNIGVSRIREYMANNKAYNQGTVNEPVVENIRNRNQQGLSNIKAGKRADMRSLYKKMTKGTGAGMPGDDGLDRNTIGDVVARNIPR